MLTENLNEQGVPHKWWALAAVCFGLFMALLDTTIVTVALPVIANDFHTGLADLQWVINAYTIALAVLIVISARLGDLFGRKKVFIIGLFIFSLGSLLCALSGVIHIGGWSATDILNFSRVVQGIGSSAMIPLSLAIISATFPAKQRGAAIGIWGGVTGFATAIGPVVGGILIASIGWESIFYLNIPIGIVGICLSMWAIRDSRDERTPRSIDVFGLITLSIFVFCLILGLMQGNDKGWSSVYILTLFGIALVSFVVFIWGELRLKHPVVDPRLFKNASYTGAAICGFTLNAGLYALFIYLSLYFENFLGFSALEAGVRVLPLSALVLFTAPIAGNLTDKFGAKFILFISMAVMAVGVLLMTVISPSDQPGDWIALLPAFIVAGLGSGLVNPPISSVALGTIDPMKAGMASGVNNVCKQIGMAFGVAFLGAMLTSRYNTEVADQISALNSEGLSQPVKGNLIEAIQNAGTIAGSTGLQGAGSSLESAPFFPAVQHVVRTSFIHGTVSILYWSAGILAIGAIAALALVKNSDMFHAKKRKMGEKHKDSLAIG